MEQGILRPEEQNILQMAENTVNMLSNASDWASNYLKDIQVKKGMERFLHEKLTTLKRIKESAYRPVALGIFGASQCGKSYLTSELVRGNDKSLSVLLSSFGQQPVGRDYLEEINPAGGRESTAIVTRFTVRPYKRIPNCSAFIRLLNITDLIKIFMNGFLFECQSDFMPTADELKKLRGSFKSSSAKDSSPLLTEDDVWDLQDYIKRHFHNQFVKMLDDINYWGILNNEIRFLPADNQIKYLEWLWGKFSKITDMFRFLHKELGGLGGQVIGVCDDALLPRTNSIIDVQRLSSLMQPGNKKCTVALENGGQLQMDGSTLCALTAELVLQANTQDEATLLKKFDVLDFPGARSRAQIYDENRITKSHDALVEVFLRGKVAYLFDRFSDDRDVTALLLCQEGGNQEAKSLPYMVNKWVEWSHGRDPKSREGKTPLLFHVFTKFDMDLVRKRGEDSAVRWDSRLKTNFEEFLGRDGDWVNEWTEGKPFQNCYWVRNPGVDQTVFVRGKDGKEFVRDEEQLKEIFAQYIANENVKKHFADPEESWKQAASPDCSGIQYLIEKLKAGIDVNTKVKQLEANIKLMFVDAKKSLQRYYIGGDITKARSLAEERAKKLIKQLQSVMITKYALPRMLDVNCFSLSTKTVEIIYDSIVNPMNIVDEENEEEAAPEAAPIFDENIFDVFGDSSESSAEKEKKSAKTPVNKGSAFAMAVLDSWQEQMAKMGKDEDFLLKVGLTADWFAETSQEFIKGASRMNLQQKISDLSNEALYSPNPGAFLKKIASQSTDVINDFVIELGIKPKEKPMPVGAPKVVLSAAAYPGLEIFKHWAISFVQLFKDNVAVATSEDEQGNKVIESILKMPI